MQTKLALLKQVQVQYAREKEKFRAQMHRELQENRVRNEARLRQLTQIEKTCTSDSERLQVIRFPVPAF